VKEIPRSYDAQSFITLKNTVFWVVTSCSERAIRFEETYRLYLHGRRVNQTIRNSVETDSAQSSGPKIFSSSIPEKQTTSWLCFAGFLLHFSLILKLEMS
jgi:hypothetical protein